MRDFAKQHDFADGGGRDAVAVFGLLELLDGDELAAIGGWMLDSREENEAVGALADLADQIVLLQPLRPAAAAAAAAAVAPAAGAEAPVSHPRHWRDFPQYSATAPSKKTEIPREREREGKGVIRRWEGGGSRSASSKLNLGRNPPWKCSSPASS